MPLDGHAYYTPPEAGRLLRVKADRIITLTRGVLAEQPLQMRQREPTTPSPMTRIITAQ